MIFAINYRLPETKVNTKMEDLRSLATQELIDLLSYMTAELTASITEKNTGAIQQYEYDISMIQSEINSRQSKANTNISDPGIEFTSEADQTL